jgi:hypothetical protein
MLTLNERNMEEQPQEQEDYRVGDKVRIRSGVESGARGIIRKELDGLLEVELLDGRITTTLLDDITNYSLAARRAWRSMPKKAGRPSNQVPKKRMVSLRIDVDLWERLGEAVEQGILPSREQAINEWVREKLESLP